MEETTIQCITVGGIETNCWVFAKKEFCAIIDPGDDSDTIISRFRGKTIFPSYILLTHGHLDHIAALPGLINAFTGSKTKPKIAIHKDDSACLGSGSYSLHRDCMTAALGGSANVNDAYIKNLWKPMPEPDLLLSDEETIGPFKVIHLPGHTPGSVAFYDEEAKVLFSGDTLFRRACGRTDLPGGDSKKLAESLKRLFTLNEKTAVCPGHGPSTTIGDEKAHFSRRKREPEVQRGMLFLLRYCIRSLISFNRLKVEPKVRRGIKPSARINEIALLCSLCLSPFFHSLC